MISIETLKDFSQVRKYECGTIFSRSNFGAEMYVILQGEVAALDSRNNKMFAMYGPGDFFNEGAILSNSKESPATFWAATDVIALPITKINTSAFIASEPKFVLELMKAMYARCEELGEDFETAAGKSWLAFREERFDEKCPDKAEIKITEAPAQTKSEEPKNTANESKAVEEKKAPQVSHDNFKLFPEGHTGDYKLDLIEPDNMRVCEIDYCCPICGKKFKGPKNLSSKLGSATTDNDLRKHYKGIEPIYYEVVTCPDCLYSSFSNSFDKPDHDDRELLSGLNGISTSPFSFGGKLDTATVFAGYYIALFCAEKCFSRPQMMEARLLHRLSWMYHDCGDTEMEMKLLKQALEKYMKAYIELDLAPEQDAQICIIIGELNFVLENIKDAKTFYHKAKTNYSASAVMRRRAENRLDAIKETEKEEEPEESEESAKKKKKHFML